MTVIYVDTLFLLNGVIDYLLLLAAALVTRFCTDLCKDGGSQALATAVETAGAVAARVIALPLLEAVVGLLLGYFA